MMPPVPSSEHPNAIDESVSADTIKRDKNFIP
jgi:hypothetical protein